MIVFDRFARAREEAGGRKDQRYKSREANGGRAFAIVRPDARCYNLGENQRAQLVARYCPRTFFLFYDRDISSVRSQADISTILTSFFLSLSSLSAMVIDYRDCCLKEPNFGCQWIMWYGDYTVSQVMILNLIETRDQRFPVIAEYVN